MQLRDLSDAFFWIRRLIFRVDRLEGGAMLENSSISNGRMRFIGGLLRVDSGGRVEIVGTLQVDGTSTVTGTFNLVGPWSFTGNGEISGNVRVLGQFNVEGPWKLIGDGEITGKVTIAGEIDLTGIMKVKGRIEVDETGRIRVGGMELNPEEHGGAITFPNGAQVFTDAETIQVFKGNSVAQVSDDYARIQHGGSVIEIDGDGVRISPGAIATALSTEGLQWMAIEVATGRLKRVPPGVGGPGTGDFDWPFPISSKTYGFRPPDRPTHNGVDLAGPDVTGHDIPSAGRGVVTFAGGNASTGYGYYVIVNHGQIDGVDVETLYGHMATPPIVSTGQTVSKGTLLGPVGNTGNSFGDHLHFEVHLDGEPVDPEPWMAAHGA
ncbi:peptidoglycan DD-metalloendopeptidase family protein [Microbacterium sp. NPDC089190]|uniref:peptidoglycan DD-metalloendopeptidase family protein n=1 Tax=Microbacterium sp. NPDC089190 TaxID=3155063 RepID=UPI00345045B2